MHRSMLQVYVKQSDRAVAFYQKAFGAELTASYPHDDGTFMHAELNVYGQILAVSEASKEEARVTGTTMQFCLHFGAGNEALVEKAYGVLKDGAAVIYPLGACSYSPLMTDLIDRYGVRWCIFV
ncbi:MAG: VOC family protein [Oscillospiraceae bacterium]